MGTYRVGFFKGVAQSGFFTFMFGAGFGYLNITLWYGFYLVTRGELTLGQLTAFNSFIITIGFALGQGAAAECHVPLPISSESDCVEQRFFDNPKGQHHRIGWKLRSW